MKKFISSISAICAAAALAMTAGAYTIDSDMGFGWSANTTIAGSEFADVTTDTAVTITITVDKSLNDVEGQNYWCFKPMVNDSGWPFIDGLEGLTLTEAGDAYAVDMEATELTFTFPQDKLELVQNAGMAIMGHGITLNEMTFSAAAPAPEAPAETPAETPAESTTEPSKGSPDTGVAGTAAVIGAGIAAAGAMFVFKKRK